MLVNAIISNGGFPPLVYQNTKGLIVCMSSSLGRREKVLPKVVVGEHEYMVAMKNCADAGFSVFAHYIRHLVCGTNAPNFKRKCKKVVRKVITKKMTEMEEKELNQLIGIANNLNQLARACNRSKMKGNPIDSVIIYVTIAEIEEALSIYMSNRQEKKNDN